MSAAATSGTLVSADGGLVAFASEAENLVPDDTNGQEDVFVRDRATGQTERVSLTGSDTQGSAASHSPALSSDGRFVAFTSSADDLAGGETPGGWDSDIYVRDRDTGSTERITDDGSGGDAGGQSGSPTISADGRFVAFWSTSPVLVVGDMNGVSDVFVHDRVLGTTERVSLDSAEAEVGDLSHSPRISAGGDFVVFSSRSDNLVPGDTDGLEDVFLRDRTTGVTELVSVPAPLGMDSGSSFARGVSADGGVVSFVSDSRLVPADTNASYDVYVRDRGRALTELVSVSSSELPAFMPRPWWPNPVNDGGAMSADGRYIAFESLAANLTAGDTNSTWDTFVRDRSLGVTERLSVAGDGSESDGWSSSASLSSTGRYAAFDSWGSNLVSGDTNGVADVFVRDRAETPATPVEDAVAVTFRGKVSYENTGQLPATAMAVTRSPGDGRVQSIAGQATIPGPNGAQATVGVSLNRVLILPLWIGSISVVDGTAGISIGTPILTTSLAGSGGDVSGTAPWIHFGGWPPRPYRLDWRVVDGG